MHADLLDAYAAGADELRQAIGAMSAAQLLARPIAGNWSTLEVLCHLADSELVFADRIKRILAEEEPHLPFADPALFAPALAYQQRDAQVELSAIELIRRQIASILRTVPSGHWTRCGIHSKTGRCTLEQVVAKAVTHLQHHLTFIHAKRQALQRPQP